jgi:hypothetical protein
MFDHRDERDPRYLWDLASVIIGLEGHSHPHIRPEYDLVWWLGADVLERYFENVIIRPRTKRSLYFPISGMAVMRQQDSYLSFFANPVRSGVINGFKHNDLLSIEYASGGENFIVDSGTYVYTGDPSGRNYFRKTSSHSTLEVDSQEINRFLPKILFSVRHDAEIKQNEWESDHRHDYISAEHSGYTRLENPIIVKRSIFFDKSNLIYLFRDDFMGAGKHLMNGNLVLESDVQVKILTNQIILRKPSGKMTILVFSSEGWLLEKVPHFISGRYGSKKESWKIRYSCYECAPRSCLWGMFGVDSAVDIHLKVSEYYRICESLGWISGSLNKLTLKRGREEITSRREIQKLFTHRLEKVHDKEKQTVSNIESE